MIEEDILIEDTETEDDVYRYRKHELIKLMRKKGTHLSHSSFNEFCKSPRHFIRYKLRKTDPTPSMKFGSMVHCAILEPEKFDSQYYVLPDTELRPEQEKNMNSTINKAWKSEMIALANGREVVTKKDYDAALRCGETVRRNETAGALLERAVRFETGVDWKYKGWDWRGKIDIDGTENGMLADLKVLADVSPRKVSSYVRFEGAGRQAVNYLRAKNNFNLDYYILAVDRGGNCSVSKIGKGLINQLSREIDWYLARLEYCIYLNQWDQSYDFYLPNGINEINAL